MSISPDQIVYWSHGLWRLSATVVFTWLVMAVLLLISWLATRRLEGDLPASRWQTALEAVVEALQHQIRQTVGVDGDRYLPFIGTLFLFIATSNLLAAVPGFHAPTASLTTTVALAVCVFVAVPIFGISRLGLRIYVRRYLQPTPLMLPFHLIGEVSRTVSLAIRLFGNIASGSLIAAILLSLTPLFVPVVAQLFGLLIGLIQAYVFSILALVYIASAARVEARHTEPTPSHQ